MSTMADQDYSRMYGDDMGYGAPTTHVESPPPRRHRQQRRGSVTENMTYVPESYVQPTSYSTHTRSYTFKDFMKEPVNTEVDVVKKEEEPQMEEYGYQATPARNDFRQDENSYGYNDYYGYDQDTTANQAAPVVSPVSNDYGYENYGYETNDMDASQTGHPEKESTAEEPVEEKSVGFTSSVPALDVEPEDASRALSPPPSA